jgi:hypothetical protein
MSDSAFQRACIALDTALSGDFRRQVVEAATRRPTIGRGLADLRDGVRSHAWNLGDARLDMSDVIQQLDTTAREEGLHVLHDWDGKAGRVTPHSIAQDALEFMVAARGDAPGDRATIAILLDYYFLYLLCLVAIRAWESGDPAANLDRVTTLLQQLQGPAGSGHRFADNAETLLLIATSHYEPNEAGYDLLLARARALPEHNRLRMALTHAQAMGGHLRFGFEVTYGRDLKAMRDDNGADYPWLLFGLAELMDEYARLAQRGASAAERTPILEGLVNGLTPDPSALLGKPVSWFAPHQAALDRFLSLLRQYRDELVPAIDVQRPRDRGYWPTALFFNFSQNVLKGTAIDAMLHGVPRPTSLNDFFSGPPEDAGTAEDRARLVRRLGAYARANPDTIRGRLSPVIVYDPVVGRQYFGGALRALKSF